MGRKKKASNNANGNSDANKKAKTQTTGETYLVKKYRAERTYAAMEAFVKYTKSHRMLDASYVRWKTGVSPEKPFVFSTRVGGVDLGWGRGKTREAAMDCACRAAFALVSAHGYNNFPLDDDCLMQAPVDLPPLPPPPPPPPPVSQDGCGNFIVIIIFVSPSSFADHELTNSQSAPPLPPGIPPGMPPFPGGLPMNLPVSQAGCLFLDKSLRPSCPFLRWLPTPFLLALFFKFECTRSVLVSLFSDLPFFLQFIPATTGVRDATFTSWASSWCPACVFTAFGRFDSTGTNAFNRYPCRFEFVGRYSAIDGCNSIGPCE